MIINLKIEIDELTDDGNEFLEDLRGVFDVLAVDIPNQIGDGYEQGQLSGEIYGVSWETE